VKSNKEKELDPKALRLMIPNLPRALNEPKITLIFL
jgi:hypothetical protein